MEEVLFFFAEGNCQHNGVDTQDIFFICELKQFYCSARTFQTFLFRLDFPKSSQLFLNTCICILYTHSNEFSKCCVNASHTHNFWYVYAFILILISYSYYSYLKFEVLIVLILTNTSDVDFNSPLLNIYKNYKITIIRVRTLQY